LSLKEYIQEQVKNAMRAKDKPRLAALRLLTAEIKQREVDQRVSLEDDAIVQAIEKMIKQCREAANQYKDAGRDDLAQQENFEIGILQEFMPEAMSEQEITQLIDEAMVETGAASMKDMGKVMAIVRPKCQGRADMSAVSAQIKSKITAKS